MAPYHNPRVYLANLVKYEYNKETKQYVPLVLNAKIPVVFILGSGYYTELSNVFNNKYSVPLERVDLEDISKAKTYKFYLTNPVPLRRYVEDEQDFLNNINLNIYKINMQLNCDGNWYSKQDISLDKGLLPPVTPNIDVKLDDNLYVARMASKIKKFIYVDNHFIKDEYIHISKQFGLFSYKKGWFYSKLTGYEYDELDKSMLEQHILSFDIDKQYSDKPVYSKEDLGIVDIYDLQEICTYYNLYIDPNKSILQQINSYKELENPINLRSRNDLIGLDKKLEINGYQLHQLNNEIMRRTLHK